MRYGAILRWSRDYGNLLTWHGVFNAPRLLVTDPELVKQILVVRAYDFVKPRYLSQFIVPVIGEGLIVAEGATHRFQRKMLNPAFSVHALRQMVPLMAKPAWSLRDKWIQAIDADPTGAPAINVSATLSAVTLDIIALAGFGEDFQLIADSTNHRLSQAYKDVSLGDQLIHRILRVLFPIYGRFPNRGARQIEHAIQTLDEETSAIVRKNMAEPNGDNMLTRMIHEVDPDTGRQMSMKELQAQCLTFMAAGHETIATALTWCLWLLAKHQDVQTVLREEIKTLLKNDGDIPSYEELNQLHLLNNVCKETLRLIPPVPVTYRVACEELTLRDRVVPKGTLIVLSPLASHLSSKFWGEDVDQFKPSRWDELPAKNVSPYVYMPFLAGPHQCIGNKFALIEMKMILCTLIKDFCFTEKPGFRFKRQHVLVTRPSPNMTLIVQRV
ncbi:hypothetical protein EC973_000460 [Apophysomyces ossiformis]|uniref:Cytochrome P450 n=1 Tax=Apophysomyces ossiformis TaxID=679940 RepID=A0A8H7BQE2_9FUNG|nr:hypothetical protein EC973_000460 [Apophysomyces ossiformis]